MPSNTAAAMADAAEALLASLDEEQRPRLGWDFPSDDERRRWYYTPTDHGGLPLAAMSTAQHRLVHRLLRAGLSEAGYVTASTIMGLENVLDAVEGFTAGFERERGRDPLRYYVRIFGRPGPEGAWAWRFGGHHVSLHFTLLDGRTASTTPCFFGADPASSPLLGPHLLRPLAAAEDLGRELVRSFDPEQRRAAVLSAVAPTDLVTVNRTTLSDGDTLLGLPEVWRGRFEGALGRALVDLQDRAERELGLTSEHLDALAFTRAPKGLSARAMSGGQRDLLRALLDTYVGRVADDLADVEAAKYAGDGLDDLHFAWAGGLEPGEPHYYRAQGSFLLAEYDNTQRGVNHVHTVWRDLAADFGGDPLADHYAHGHH